MIIIVLIVLFVLLNIGDAIITATILKWGGRVANPFVAFFMKKSGVLPALFVTKAVASSVAVAVFGYSLPNDVWSLLAILFVDVVYAGALVNNFRVMRSL